MKKTHSQTSHSIERKDVVDVFKRMLADKKAVQNYICKHGTLKGFKDESILFAKHFLNPVDKTGDKMT